MIALDIHLQAMVTNDTVVVRGNGKEVCHEISVTIETKRMRFWAALYERSHAFHLAHAWQKALGVSGIRPCHAVEGHGLNRWRGASTHNRAPSSTKGGCYARPKPCGRP
jgi:hypothetical protein